MSNSIPDYLALLLDGISSDGLPPFITSFLPSLIVGTNSNDSLAGSRRRDYIFGLAGDDSIEGLGGNDFLFSGEGNNTVRGGDGQDRIYGGSGRDLLFGDAGNDRFIDVSGGNKIDGGEGRDTVDYQDADGAIALKFDIEFDLDAGGISFFETGRGILQIVQADLEPDNISNIERIIGPRGEANTIDFQENFFAAPFTSGTIIAPAIDVNLSENRLSFLSDRVSLAADQPSFLDTDITVNNFVNVIGSIRDDIIVGNNAANNLNGFLGDDILEGGGGNDFISTFERDTLTGGSGRDTFNLKASDKSVGSFLGPFPGPRPPFQASTILDFQANFDKIQLSSIDEVVFFGFGSSTIYEGFEALPIGELDPDLFRLTGSGEAPRSPHIAYDTATGDLFYDRGALGSNKIATLQGSPTLSASDIVIV